MKEFIYIGTIEGVSIAALFLSSIAWLLIIKKGGRPPLAFKLLRAPGESLRKKIVALDENLIWPIFFIILAPFLLAFGVLRLSLLVLSPHSYGSLLPALLAFLLTLALGIGWLLKLFSKRRNLLLGYLGERAVAEHLEKLRSAGYFIVHDFPAENGSRQFNLDHIVVGPTGLFAVETKTRRKGRARTGFKDHEVTFDGRQLIWPWGEDTFGLEQAANEAEWLQKWVKTMTGQIIPVRPILALPGWFVINRAKGPVNVQNEKNLASAIRGHGTRTLSAEQIELLSRQFEARCRDVED